MLLVASYALLVSIEVCQALQDDDESGGESEGEAPVERKAPVGGSSEKLHLICLMHVQYLVASIRRPCRGDIILGFWPGPGSVDIFLKISFPRV